MGPCLGTHWEVDLDAGHALLRAVTLTPAVETGHRVLVCRAGLSQSEALPRPCLLPTRCRRWPQSSSRHAGLAPHGPVGSSRLGEGRRPGLLCLEGLRQPRLGDTAQPLCGLQPHRPLSQQRPSGRAVGCAGGSVRWGWLTERTLTFLGSSPLQGAASGPHQSPGRPHPPFLTAEPSGLRSPRKARGCPAQSQPPTRLPGGCFPAVTPAGFYVPPAGAGLWG